MISYLEKFNKILCFFKNNLHLLQLDFIKVESKTNQNILKNYFYYCYLY